MLALKVCPGCEKKYRPFYGEQIYCDDCREGENDFGRDGSFTN